MKKNKKNRYVTKMNLYIRILVAGYVVYIAYQLIPSIQAASAGTEKIWMGVAAALLGIAGLVIVGLSIKGLIRKEYYEADEIADLEAAENADQAEDVVDTTAVDIDTTTENIDATVENTEKEDPNTSTD